MGQDVGYQGNLVSLSGIPAKKGTGIQTRMTNATATAAAYTDIIGANPRRVWMLIANKGTAEVFVTFGDPGATTGLPLQVNDVLQVDQNLPWCGPFQAGSPTAALNLNIIEAELAQV